MGKTELMLIPRGQKQIRAPAIRIGDDTMNNSNTLNYLGLVLDRAFNYIEHLRSIREKSMKVASKLVNATRRSYGCNAECMEQIVERVAKPAILYGSESGGARRHR